MEIETKPDATGATPATQEVVDAMDHKLQLQRITNNNNAPKQNIRLKVMTIAKPTSQRIELKCRELTNLNGNGVPPESESDPAINVVLEGVWTQNRIFEQAIIHLVYPEYKHESQTYIVDNSKGFLVIEPDSLLTCTYVASSLFCERKTWLNNVFLGQIGTNRAMLVGTLVHEVFQYGVKHKITDSDKLYKYLNELLDDATVMLEIYSVEVHLNDIRNEAKTYIFSVKDWIEKYMLSGPRHPLTNDENIEVKIIGVSDIEENVWSTKYGLKGKIDVTGSVRVYDRRTKIVCDKIIPLELKTGNPNLSPSHAAQVSLYSMMIEDRYAETNQGFVIYLKERAAMHNVALTHNIKRDLIQRRNKINYYNKDFFHGPEMLDQKRMCENCERLTECILTSNLYMPGEIKHFPTMQSLESAATGHLDDKFVKFFQTYHEKFVKLMAKPKGSANGDKATSLGTFWNYTSEEAESMGLGIGKLRLILPDKTDTQDSIILTFVRHPSCREQSSASQKSTSDYGSMQSSDAKSGATPPSPAKPAKRMKINDFFRPVAKPLVAAVPVGDKLNDADEPRPKPDVPCGGKVFNTNVDFSRCRLAISLDRDAHSMDSQNSSTAIAIGFMQDFSLYKFKIKLYEGALDAFKTDDNVMYRVDKLEKRSTSLDAERTVLVRLLARDDWRCARIRQLLLDDQFKPKVSETVRLFLSSKRFDCLTNVSNDAAREFVIDALATDTYALLDERVVAPIKGDSVEDPKVDKIVSVFSQLAVELDKSVLIVANNVDRLTNLMKLLSSAKVKFILLDGGACSTKARYMFASNLVKVIQSETIDVAKRYDAYIRMHELAPVVICSYAMSLGGLLFTRRTFNYCVCYDCDNTELLAGLSPMFCSDKYVLLANGPATNDSYDVSSTTLGAHLKHLHSASKKTAAETEPEVISLE